MRDSNFLKSNKGFSLIELIVTIAIMSALVGGATLGINLVFSRDAQKCATALNDAVYEARMMTMTRDGDFELQITENSGNFVAQIIRTDLKTGAVEVAMEIQLSENKKIKSIERAIDTDAMKAVSASDVSTIKFDRSKGCVTNFDGQIINTPAGTGEHADGVIVYNITPSRGSSESKVSLVTATGKHTIGDF